MYRIWDVQGQGVVQDCTGLHRARECNSAAQNRGVCTRLYREGCIVPVQCCVGQRGGDVQDCTGARGGGEY